MHASDDIHRVVCFHTTGPRVYSPAAQCRVPGARLAPALFALYRLSLLANALCVQIAQPRVGEALADRRRAVCVAFRWEQVSAQVSRKVGLARPGQASLPKYLTRAVVGTGRAQGVQANLGARVSIPSSGVGGGERAGSVQSGTGEALAHSIVSGPSGARTAPVILRAEMNPLIRCQHLVCLPRVAGRGEGPTLVAPVGTAAALEVVVVLVVTVANVVGLIVMLAEVVGLAAALVLVTDGGGAETNPAAVGTAAGTAS